MPEMNDFRKIHTQTISRRELELEAENADLRERLSNTERELTRVERICDHLSDELERWRNE